MSISPPLDIVLDVAKAADPARYKQAVARLSRLAAPSDPSFGSLVEPAAVPAPASFDAGLAPSSAPGGPPDKPIPADAAKAYRGFEAMTLKTFIEAAMPEDTTAIFGSGTAGEVWKSMLAEQIADQMARAGGIGIAAQLARFEARGETSPQAAVGPISAKDTPLDPQLVSMVVERRLIERISPHGAAVPPGKASG